MSTDLARMGVPASQLRGDVDIATIGAVLAELGPVPHAARPG